MKLLAADYYYRELTVSRQQNQYFSAIKMYEFIKEKLPQYNNYDRQFAVLMSDWISGMPDRRYSKFGADKLKAILPEIKGNGYADLYAQAKIESALAVTGDQQYLSPAETDLKTLIGLCPDMPRNYIALGQFYTRTGNEAGAIDNFNLAIAKMPALADARMNSQHRQAVEQEIYNIYLGLGDMYLAKNDMARAEAEYKKALELNVKIINAYQKLAELFYKKDDLNQSIWYNERVLEMDPKNLDAAMALENSYLKKGDKAKAEYYKNIVSGLKPL
jgi:Tfp pilus assembly protein PilF